MPVVILPRVAILAKECWATKTRNFFCDTFAWNADVVTMAGMLQGFAKYYPQLLAILIYRMRLGP